MEIQRSPEPLRGVWLAWEAMGPTGVTPLVLDDTMGVQRVDFQPDQLTILEGIEATEAECRALTALASMARLQRSQAVDFEAWKHELAVRAGEAANEHDFCSVYDRLMEEVGLPVLRDQDHVVSVVIRTSVTVSARSQEHAEESITWADILEDLQNYTPNWEVDE